MIKVGEINQFIVLRESDLGYMLTNKGDDVLLHFNQCQDRVLRMNETVEAFVQYDSQGRLSATLETPSATISRAGFGKVVETNPKLGVFVNINTFKDVLISKDDLPKNAKYWPEVGDELPIRLKTWKDKLNAFSLKKNDILEFHPFPKKYNVGDKLTANVVYVSENCINLCTKTFDYIYVSKNQFRGNHHVGEQMELTCIGMHDDEIVCSANKASFEMIDEDSEAILKYLEKHNSLPLDAKSSAEDVEMYFKMSRKAFKRALGDLYKNRKVTFEDGKTFLVK